MIRFSTFPTIFAFLLSLFLLYYLIQILFIFPFFDLSLEKSSYKRSILEKWTDCARKKFDTVHNAEEFWNKFVPFTTHCDHIYDIERLGMIGLKNDDEVKYALMPSRRPVENETISFITLGIGKDVTAEKAFREESYSRGYHVKFFGADPVTELNSDLYSKIGEYFPFAIGDKNEISNASVFKNGVYVPEEVNHVELLHFLKNDLKISQIDHLWLDAEGAEFGLFDYFYSDGPLERNGISFCQMNLEVHIGGIDQKTEFMKFAKRLALENRFVMLKSVYMSHIRLFLFNFRNTKCADKYL
ncbi:hypothetical protein CAEBREN_23646 [Caenorhabditis brenneri]|uniref:Methyltransferase FkbM domain-containing protein n=1 Tax=Caenorhabditis brenneri TaxID=135651 RepID=G0MNT7_CAEBE|nr:hypothetical protein CAEBREN_23646 [Caenorhabditis brenneri]